jgi:hypothetical protein
MEAATIAVLIITAAFLGLCMWIEWHSRRRPVGTAGVETIEEALPVTAEEKPPQSVRRRRRLRN